MEDSDPQIDAVHARIEHAREHLGDTLEALAYKTDIPARATDALNDGLAVAKDNLTTAATAVGEKLETVRDAAAIASELAVEQAKGLTEQAKVVAAQASDATHVAASNASDAVSAAVSEPASRKRATYGLIGIVAFVVIALLLRRRKKAVDIVIDGVMEVDDLTLIDPADLESLELADSSEVNKTHGTID